MVVRHEQHTRWSVCTSRHMVIVNVHTLMLLCQSRLGESCCVAEYYIVLLIVRKASLLYIFEYMMYNKHTRANYTM